METDISQKDKLHFSNNHIF